MSGRKRTKLPTVYKRGDIRVKLASTDEIRQLGRWERMALPPEEPSQADFLAEHDVAGELGRNILLGLRRGPEALHDELMGRALSDGLDGSALLIRSRVVLVAHVGPDGPVGAALCGPSGNLNTQLLGRMKDGDAAMTAAFISGVSRLTKLHVLAVDEAYRKSGVGQSLFEAAARVYKACGYWRLYGAVETERNLSAFYTSCGCDMRPAGQPLDVSNEYLLPVFADGRQGDQMFVRNLD